jgi:hypothetical protein
MKLFMSYAEADRAVGAALADKLRKAGLEVWDAEKGVLPGQNFGEQMAKALEQAEALVAILSREAMRSAWVQHEIMYALAHQRFAKQRLILLRIKPSNGVPRTFGPVISHETKDVDSAVRLVLKVLGVLRRPTSHPRAGGNQRRR